MSPDIIVCADWSMSQSKRSVYLAETGARTVGKVAGEAWTLPGLVNLAEQRRGNGRALLSVDLPLGIPITYLNAARQEQGWHASATFADWLPLACETPRFMEPVLDHADWKVARPFFKVPTGEGSLSLFVNAARDRGVVLWRRIESSTHGKSVFCFGLPGQVAPAAQSFWTELASALMNAREFKLWPFEGTLGDLLQEPCTVLAEIYPRAAYATALAETLPCRPLAISKKKYEARNRALQRLRNSSWIREFEVRLEDLDDALDSDDDFDALMTACALLRCVLTLQPLSSREFEDPVAEGGILCTGTLVL